MRGHVRANVTLAGGPEGGNCRRYVDGYRPDTLRGGIGCDTPELLPLNCGEVRKAYIHSKNLLAQHAVYAQYRH